MRAHGPIGGTRALVMQLVRIRTTSKADKVPINAANRTSGYWNELISCGLARLSQTIDKPHSH
jgi:hypothetical protein